LGVLTREESKTVLFVTHDIDEAILLADRIIFIDKHSIQADIEVGIKKPITKAELIDNEQFRTLNSHLMSLFYRGVAENIGHEVYL
jgi:NitT/TauT family transport system ATP-binding protein